MLDKIEKELIKQQKQIKKDLRSFISEKQSSKNEHRAKFPEYGNKNDENAQEINEYTTNLATEKVLEKALRDVENALERIKEGTYGICKYCEQKINEKRLLARPVASSCVDCKRKLQESN